MSGDIEKITSLQNARIKAIRALELRKTRRETGLFVVEGAAVIIAARDAGFVPETLVYLADHAAGDIVAGVIAWGAAVSASQSRQATGGAASNNTWSASSTTRSMR